MNNRIVSKKTTVRSSAMGALRQRPLEANSREFVSLDKDRGKKDTVKTRLPPMHLSHTIDDPTSTSHLVSQSVTHDQSFRKKTPTSKDKKKPIFGQASQSANRTGPRQLLKPLNLETSADLINPKAFETITPQTTGANPVYRTQQPIGYPPLSTSSQKGSFGFSASKVKPMVRGYTPKKNMSLKTAEDIKKPEDTSKNGRSVQLNAPVWKGITSMTPTTTTNVMKHLNQMALKETPNRSHTEHADLDRSISNTQVPDYPSDLPILDPAKLSNRENGVIKAYGANTHQGLVRNYNEDRVAIILNIIKPPHLETTDVWPKCSFFGVYDGHGGSLCPDFLRDNLHQFVLIFECLAY